MDHDGRGTVRDTQVGGAVVIILQLAGKFVAAIIVGVIVRLIVFAAAAGALVWYLNR